MGVGRIKRLWPLASALSIGVALLLCAPSGIPGASAHPRPTTLPTTYGAITIVSAQTNTSPNVTTATIGVAAVPLDGSVFVTVVANATNHPIAPPFILPQQLNDSEHNKYLLLAWEPDLVVLDPTTYYDAIGVYGAMNVTGGTNVHITLPLPREETVVESTIVVTGLLYVLAEPYTFQSFNLTNIPGVDGCVPGVQPEEVVMGHGESYMTGNVTTSLNFGGAGCARVPQLMLSYYSVNASHSTWSSGTNLTLLNNTHSVGQALNLGVYTSWQDVDWTAMYNSFFTNATVTSTHDLVGSGVGVLQIALLSYNNTNPTNGYPQNNTVYHPAPVIYQGGGGLFLIALVLGGCGLFAVAYISTRRRWRK